MRPLVNMMWWSWLRPSRRIKPLKLATTPTRYTRARKPAQRERRARRRATRQARRRNRSAR